MLSIVATNPKPCSINCFASATVLATLHTKLSSLFVMALAMRLYIKVLFTVTCSTRYIGSGSKPLTAT